MLPIFAGGMITGILVGGVIAIVLSSEILLHYQTLAVGMATVLVGVFTILCLVFQISQRKNEIIERAWRRDIAAKSMIPIILSRLTVLSKDSVVNVSEMIRGNPPLRDIDLPESDIETIKHYIENAESRKIAERYAVLLNIYQIYKSRYSGTLRKLQTGGYNRGGVDLDRLLILDHGSLVSSLELHFFVLYLWRDARIIESDFDREDISVEERLSSFFTFNLNIAQEDIPRTYAFLIRVLNRSVEKYKKYF